MTVQDFGAPGDFKIYLKRARTRRCIQEAKRGVKLVFGETTIGGGDKALRGRTTKVSKEDPCYSQERDCVREQRNMK